jgi:uncharacterized membrane protein
MTKKIYRPTALTLFGVATTIGAIAGTAGFLLGRAPMLGYFLPVHFDHEGVPDRWLRTSLAIVLVPVWIQLTLALVFGSIAGLLLYRTRPLRRDVVEDEAARQDRERMLVTAEAISLLSAIWITFQGLAAVRILHAWQRWWGDLGEIYGQSLVVAIVLSVIVGIRAHVNMRHANPAARPSNDANWRFKGLYFNPEDPALFVPLRSGIGWTLNFGRPRAIVFLLVFLAFGIGAPILIMRILLGE